MFDLLHEFLASDFNALECASLTRRDAIIANVHDNEEDCLVVKGPVSPRNITEEETLTVAANGCSIFYVENTPVILFGLKKAMHLNGKVGEIRSRNEMTGRYEVHFEDKNLTPHMILRENFSILFELPEIG